MATPPNGAAKAPTSLASLRAVQTHQPPAMRRGIAASMAAAPVTNGPDIRVGFTSQNAWEFTKQVARGLSLSTLVPEAYRAHVPVRGRRGEFQENPSAIPNCIIALNMADRSGEDPIAVMQNLHIIEGRPSWSSPYIISRINRSGRFSPLKWRIRDLGPTVATYEYFEWSGGGRSARTIEVKLEKNLEFVAYATEKASGEVLESTPVTLAMAVQEGWYTKPGSKWRTMTDQMGCYRAATFFSRLHCPEVLMGLRTADENHDIVFEADRDTTGTWVPNIPPENDEADEADEADENGELVAEGGAESAEDVQLGSESTDPAAAVEEPVAKKQEPPQAAPAEVAHAGHEEVADEIFTNLDESDSVGEEEVPAAPPPPPPPPAPPAQTAPEPVVAAKPDQVAQATNWATRSVDDIREITSRDVLLAFEQNASVNARRSRLKSSDKLKHLDDMVQQAIEAKRVELEGARDTAQPA